MANPDPPSRTEAVRRFHRFYTRQLGLLQEKLPESPFSPTEARVLYQLAHQQPATATQLRRELGLDAGYLSRIQRGFRRRRLIERTAAPEDGRQAQLTLTGQGLRAIATLDQDSRAGVESLLSRLSDGEQKRLVDAMVTIEQLLGATPAPPLSYLLRPHQPGDIGWVVHRHGVLYAEEHGWDERFEALVAEIAARFIQQFDARRERCWIAEMAGEIVGSVFVVRQSEEVARLRLLLVEPKARGFGIGGRLVFECIRFARQVGYRKLALWTDSALHRASHIYQKAGFKLLREEPHQSFGKDLIGQTWELEL